MPIVFLEPCKASWSAAVWVGLNDVGSPGWSLNTWVSFTPVLSYTKSKSKVCFQLWSFFWPRLGSGVRHVSLTGKCCGEFCQQSVVSSSAEGFHVCEVQASISRTDAASVNERWLHWKHFFAVDSLLSLLQNTWLTILPSLIYTETIIYNYFMLGGEGKESLHSEFPAGFHLSAQKLQGAVEVLSSLAVGRLFGPGFVEVSPTSNPRGCHHGQVQQRLFEFLSLPLDVSVSGVGME